MMEVADLMERRTVTVSANDYALEALSLMQEKGLTRVLVVDRNEVVGMVELRDLVRHSRWALAERDVREYLRPGDIPAEPGASADGLTCGNSLLEPGSRRLRDVIIRRSRGRSARRPRVI